MIIVHKKNNKPRISWASYSPMFLQEMVMVSFYLGDKEAQKFESLVRKVSAAHNKKANNRHGLEGAMIRTLKKLAKLIQAKEGFDPSKVWIKEE